MTQATITSTRGMGAIFGVALVGLCGCAPAADELDTSSGDESGESGDSDDTGDTGDTGDSDESGSASGDECMLEDLDADAPFSHRARAWCGTWFPSALIEVAPGADGLFATGATPDHWWLFAVDDEGIHAVEGVPGTFQGERVLLANDSSGRLQLAADSAPGTDLDGGLTVVLDDGDGTVSHLVAEVDPSTPALGFELTSEDAPYVFFSSDPPDEFSVARLFEGDWQESVLTLPGDARDPRFTISSDDQVVALAAGQEGSGYQMKARVGGGPEFSIGSPLPAQWPASFKSLPHTLPSLDAEGPRFAVAIQRTEGLRVAWPDETNADGWSEAEIADTEIGERQCDSNLEDLPECDDTCHDEYRDTPENSFAIARTQDGRVWAAYSVTYVDRDYHFEKSCDENDCLCQDVLDQDDTTSQLFLAHVPLDGSEPEIVGSLPLSEGVLHVQDMRAFGADLAIGMKVDGPPDGLEIVRVDTSLIE